MSQFNPTKYDLLGTYADLSGSKSPTWLFDNAHLHFAVARPGVGAFLLATSYLYQVQYLRL